MSGYMIRSTLSQSGLDMGKAVRSLRGVNQFRRNHAAFLQAAKNRSDFAISERYPCLADRSDQSGAASGQYFHQDLIVAQKIHIDAPVRHVDVGSRVDGFVAHVASFRRIEVLDIRPLESPTTNITFIQRDITEPDAAFDQMTDSLSCLHTLEHIGLGRYGDRIDYDGYRVGWMNLIRMLKPNAKFFFSVPIGMNQRIEFDAHRIFSIPFLKRELFEPSGLVLEELHYVDDDGALHTNVKDREGGQRTFGLKHGCGIFELRAPSPSGAE
jgi:hypothetical protein